MPRTVNLPSDLIDTQARSFARTVTSNGGALEAVVLAAALFRLADSGGVGLTLSADSSLGGVVSDSLAFCAEFRSSGLFVAGAGSAPGDVLVACVGLDVLGFATFSVDGIVDGGAVIGALSCEVVLADGE